MKCKCGNEFEPFSFHNSTIKQKMCVPCLIAKGSEKRIKTANKEWRKEKSELKAKLKTKSEWLNDLQKVFNTYIRERDYKKPCVSCDKPLVGKFDASHFFSVGAYPNLRFNEDNVHGGCVECNRHKHGNISEYAIKLPLRIGQERFDNLLSNRNKPLNISIEDIKQLTKIYIDKTKKIQEKRL